jgi:uncharacterized membrane protein YdjX (TVP38/TMEM64 family)
MEKRFWPMRKMLETVHFKDEGFDMGIESSIIMNSHQIRRFLCVFLLSIIGFFSIMGIFSYIDPYPLKDWIHLRIMLQKVGVSGAVLFIFCVAIMPLAAPLSLLIMAGSSVYGAPLGMALSYVGCMINANLVFFLVKTLGVETAWGHGKKTYRVKNAIKENGYPLVLILQILTIVPFTAINFAAAASGVCWRDFMKATILGIVPGIAIFSLLGHMVLTQFFTPRFYFSFICAAVFMITLVALIKKNTQLRNKTIVQIVKEELV